VHLIWRESARLDLRAIISYISEHDSKAATDLNEGIEALVERLTMHPFMYRTGRVPGTREAVVHPNYILVCRVGADELEVVNVLHSRQNYPPE